MTEPEPRGRWENIPALHTIFCDCVCVYLPRPPTHRWSLSPHAPPYLRTVPGLRGHAFFQFGVHWEGLAGPTASCCSGAAGVTLVIRRPLQLSVRLESVHIF